MNLEKFKKFIRDYIFVPMIVFVFAMCPCSLIVIMQLINEKALTEGVDFFPTLFTSSLLLLTLLWMVGYIGMVYDKKYLGWVIETKVFEKLSSFTNLFWYHNNNTTRDYLKESSIIIYLWFLCWWGNLYYFLTYLKVDNFHGLDSLLDGIYFSFITAFTIGYGDFYPMKWIGKLLVILEIFFNFLFIIAIFQKVYSDEIGKKIKKK